MPEQFTSEREDHMKSTVDTLANRTPEEKAASLDAGLKMLVDDLPENREFYARMEGLRELRDAEQRKQSDALFKAARQLYGPLGYDTSSTKNP